MDIKRFRSGGKMYHYILTESVKSVSDLPRFEQYQKSEYQNVGMSFDIETTSFETLDGSWLATMYIWQFAVGEYTVIGRTWEQFVDFMELLNERAEQLKIKLLILVQNFSFEFQFIKAWFEWNNNPKTGNPDIFAKSDREIIYAKWKNCEFRDTLTLTGMSLKSYNKNYNIGLDKLIGDLDYKICRHSGTKTITNKELSYCINDVQILRLFYEKYIIPYYIKQNKTIPLTSTGIVRQEMKELFFKESKDYKKKYRKLMHTCFPTNELYIVMRQYLFRGGLTHANTSLCNALLKERVASFDLKSAHPSSMLREKFPYKYYRVNKNLFQNVLEETKTGNFGFLGSFTFKNIRAKGWHCLESKNKLVHYAGEILNMETNERSPGNSYFENGRLAYSDRIEVVLCDIDYQNYLKMYEWEAIECNYLYECNMEYLPDFLRKMVCNYFEKKEIIDKSSFEYGLAKRKLNALFGMCSTGIVENEIFFDPELNIFVESSDTKNYHDLTRNLLLLPQWSVYIAAYTRRDIVDLLYLTGPDSIYYDTDSDKIMNYEKHLKIIEDFNNQRIEANRNMELYDFEKKHFEKIGCFELEYVTDPNGLKVLGAKRYITKHNGKTEVTVAGMVKGSLEEYCKTHYRNECGEILEIKPGEQEFRKPLDIFEMFTDGLILPKLSSRKQTTSYYDQEFSYKLTDFEGKTKIVHEKSCVAIFDIPFKMNIEEEFLYRISLNSLERQNQVYKGVL